MTNNVKLLSQAQRMLETLRVDFEGQTFTRETSGISVAVKGTMEMVAVTAPEGASITADMMMAAYSNALHVAKYARSIAIVQIRNQLLKSRFDILPLMSEVRDALDFLNTATRPDNYQPD